MVFIAAALAAVGAAAIAGAVRESKSWRSEVGAWRVLTSQVSNVWDKRVAAVNHVWDQRVAAVNNTWDKRVETEFRETRALAERVSAAWRNKAERTLQVADDALYRVADIQQDMNSLVTGAAPCLKFWLTTSVISSSSLFMMLSAVACQYLLAGFESRSITLIFRAAALVLLALLGLLWLRLQNLIHRGRCDSQDWKYWQNPWLPKSRQLKFLVMVSQEFALAELGPLVMAFKLGTPQPKTDFYYASSGKSAWCQIDQVLKNPEDFDWVALRNGIPFTAVRVGIEIERQPLYAALCNHKGTMIPGKAGHHITSLGKPAGLYGDGYLSDSDNTFIMCARLGVRPVPQWISQEPEQPYTKPVTPTGTLDAASINIDNKTVCDLDGSPSFVARAIIKTLGQKVGKSSATLLHLHFGLESREARSFEPYEILRNPNDFDWKPAGSAGIRWPQDAVPMGMDRFGSTIYAALCYTGLEKPVIVPGMAITDSTQKKGFAASYSYAGRHLEAKSKVLIMCYKRVAEKPRQGTLHSETGESLKDNQVLYSSNGKFALQLQQDCGKLTLYDLDTIFNIDSNKTQRWASWEYVPSAVRPHSGPYKLSFEADHRSMSVRDAQGCIWNSQTWRSIVAPVHLDLQDDGVLVLRGSDGAVAWTNTQPADNLYGDLEAIPGGEVLMEGRTLFSNSGTYGIIIQEFGHLVLRHYGKAFDIHSGDEVLWSTQGLGPDQHLGPYTLRLSSFDQVLRLFNSKDWAYWYSKTWKERETRPPVRLQLLDDGNLVVWDSKGYCFWMRHDTSRLYGECAAVSFFCQENNFFSQNGKFSLNMQADGNLVLYQLNERYKTEQHIRPLRQTPVWSTDTWNHPEETKGFHVQRDHNMCVYAGHTCIWASLSHNDYYDRVRAVGGHVYLVLQDDGNLVLFDKLDNLVWAAR